MKTFTTVLLALFFAACDAADNGEGEGEGDTGEGEGEGEAPAFVSTLTSTANVAQLADANGAVKFLMPVQGAPATTPTLDGCVFQNTVAFPFHLLFLRSLPGGESLTTTQYVERVLRRDTRAWWGGELRFDANRAHPLRDVPGVMLFALYTEDTAGNRLVIDDVRAVHAGLSSCMDASLAPLLAFVPTSTEQRQTSMQIASTLAAEGIAVLP
jgi:hypothetical protein